MDEFRLEVTPLDKEPPPVDGQQDGIAAREHDSEPASVGTSRSFVNGVRLGQRARRYRVLRAGSTLGVVLIALVVLLLIPSGTRAVVFQLVAGPTATSTAVPLRGGDHFLWEHTVPWGTLLIDGKPGPDVRVLSLARDEQGQLQASGFHLPRGRHTLDYHAALFPTLHCTVSVPRAATDTCPRDLQNTYPFILSEPGIRVLDLQATVDRLPPEQTRALATLTQARLDAAAEAEGQDAIGPGDHLLGADGSPMVVNTPLSAQVHFALSESGVLDRPENVTHCALLLCSTDDIFAPSNPGAWTIYAPVALSWRYLRADGSVALGSGPSATAKLRASVAVAVTTRWEQQQWQVQLAPVDPRQRDPVICAVGGHGLDVLRTSPDQTAVDLRLQWPYEASIPGLGCLFAGSMTFDTAANPTGTVALVLYRCGVLLAVNAEAQHIFPHLPHASAHEQELARLVAPPGVTASP